MNEEFRMKNLAPTPLMGWNSWNTFGQTITENEVRETADALVESGLAALGYTYVVIDDFWEAEQRINGRLNWNPETFPGGIPALADYVHSKGLKFGIYSCAGVKTCGGMPASFGYEELDAATFAEWGVDFLKYDFCYHPPLHTARDSYRRMGNAVLNCGREMVFSMCCWGFEECWTWARSCGAQMWRTTDDIKDKWSSIYDIGFRRQRELSPYAGPGGWNDPDMLVVGMRGRGNVAVIDGKEGDGCTDDEYRTHFALWCMLAAPLMIGADVRNLNESALTILSNERLIAVNQDPLGSQACPIGAHRNAEIWRKPLADGSVVVGCFNLGPSDQSSCPVSWRSLGFAETAECRVTELISGEDRGIWSRFCHSERLPSHGCEILRIAPLREGK